MLPAQNHFANLNSFFKIVQGCQLYWFTFCNKNHQFLGKNYIDKLVPLLIQPLSYHFSHVFWSIWRKKMTLSYHNHFRFLGPKLLARWLFTWSLSCLELTDDDAFIILVNGFTENVLRNLSSKRLQLFVPIFFSQPTNVDWIWWQKRGRNFVSKFLVPLVHIVTQVSIK